MGPNVQKPLAQARSAKVRNIIKNRMSLLAKRQLAARLRSLSKSEWEDYVANCGRSLRQANRDRGECPRNASAKVRKAAAVPTARARRINEAVKMRKRQLKNGEHSTFEGISNALRAKGILISKSAVQRACKAAGLIKGSRT